MMGALPLISSALVGLAVAATTAWILPGLAGLVESVRPRVGGRTGVQSLVMESHLASPARLPVHVLDGGNAAAWFFLACMCAAVGWLLTLFLFPSEALFLQHAGAAVGLVPAALWRARKQARRRDILRQVRMLLTELGLLLRFETPGRALLTVAERSGPGGLVQRRLQVLVNAYLRRGRSPDDVLEQLGEDLRSPELRRLVARLRAAQTGDAEFARVLAPTLQEMIAEGEAAADAAVEAAPERLQAPMIVALLLPVIILLVFPLGNFVIEQIAGLTSP